MLETDANGYANIKWPSKNVPYGGILHARKATISPQDQQFIKVLLNEQKQTIIQKKSQWKLRDFDKEEEPLRVTQKVAKAYYGPEFRVAQTGKRSLASIRKSGDLDVDTFNPIPRGVNREELKQRLQDLMEFGPRLNQNKIKLNNLKPPKSPVVPLTPHELRQELISQIRERVEWLKDMEKLGEAQKHRPIINGEINDRLRQIRALGLDDEPIAYDSKSVAGSRQLSATSRKGGGDDTPKYQTNSKIDHKDNDQESIYEFSNALLLRKAMKKYR